MGRTDVTGRREQMSFAEIGAMLTGAAIGSLVYWLVLEILIGTEAVHTEPSYDDAAFRDSLLWFGSWALLVVGALIVWLASRRTERPGRLVLAGAALLGAGAAFFGWSAVDMHGLGLYDWRPGSPAGALDFCYHGAGVLVAVVGYGLLAGATRDGGRAEAERGEQRQLREREM